MQQTLDIAKLRFYSSNCNEKVCRCELLILNTTTIQIVGKCYEISNDFKMSLHNLFIFKNYWQQHNLLLEIINRMRNDKISRCLT